MITKLFSFISANKKDLIVFLLGVLALFAIHLITYEQGYSAGVDATKTKWQEERIQLLAQLQQLTQQAAQVQLAHDNHVLQLERQSHEDQKNIIIDYEQRLATVTAGQQRVYIPARCPDIGTDTAGTATARTPSRVQDARAELDPAVVADLAAIARDGDLAIVQRNELIERYNAARSALIELQNGTKGKQ